MEDAAEDSDILVRSLRPDDLDPVIGLDAKVTGHRREGFFQKKLAQNLHETGVKVSLAAELEGCFVGALLARVYYGEFGMLEPVAVLDTLVVHPDFQKRGVGRALLAQLKMNLVGLKVTCLRTEVSWDAPGLLAFFQREGFRPAARLCLDLEVKPGA